MAKKDFSSIGASTGSTRAERVYSSLVTFIRMMSKATGMTMTKFTNAIIAAYRNEHPEFLQQAQALLKAVETSTFSAQITPDQSGAAQTDDQ